MPTISLRKLHDNIKLFTLVTFISTSNSPVNHLNEKRVSEVNKTNYIERIMLLSKIRYMIYGDICQVDESLFGRSKLFIR